MIRKKIISTRNKRTAPRAFRVTLHLFTEKFERLIFRSFARKLLEKSPSPRPSEKSKKTLTIRETKKNKVKQEKGDSNVKKTLSPRKFIRRPKLRRRGKLRRKYGDGFYFGPQVECQ